MFARTRSGGETKSKGTGKKGAIVKRVDKRMIADLRGEKRAAKKGKKGGAGRKGAKMAMIAKRGRK